MKKIPLSKRGENKDKYFALVDDEVYDSLSKHNWHIKIENNTIYAKRRLGKTSILMHRVIMGVPRDYFVDHKDGNGLNNQKTNLRVVTRQQNNFNKRKSRNNKTGFKGVYFEKPRGKYVAYIMKDYKRINLGRFNSKIEAAKAYNEKALELYGSFARINLING